MNKKINLGFIGGGVNSAIGSTHFIAAQMDGRFKVVAGCFSRNKDVNGKTAMQWGITQDRQYECAQEFLEKERGRVDAVVVLTPTPSHKEIVIQALKYDYPVICEKSLAISSAEAKDINKIKNERQGYLAVTYNYTGYPMLRELKHMIDQKRLGRLEQVHIEMPQEGFARLDRDGRPMTPQGWRLQDAELPTISLDLGVHLHHIIDFLTNEKPLDLVAVQSSQGRFRQVIDNTMCIARYTNDLDCSIWFSKSALGCRNGLRVRVFGENGSAEWYQMEPESLMFYDNTGQKTIVDRASVDVLAAHDPRYNRFKSGHPSGFIEAFANLYWDIANNLEVYLETGVQNVSEYVYTGRHALEGLTMLEAISGSSNDRCWKSLITHPE